MSRPTTLHPKVWGSATFKEETLDLKSRWQQTASQGKNDQQVEWKRTSKKALSLPLANELGESGAGRKRSAPPPQVQLHGPNEKYFS